jgi:penicillin-binding protein 2
MVSNDLSRDPLKSIFSRRAFILLLGKITIAFLIITRLFTLQIYKGKNYKTLSDKNRIKLIPLQPRRGTIMDTKGIPLAEDVLSYKSYFYKQKGVQNDAVLEETMDTLALHEEKKRELRKAIKRVPYLYPIAIQDNLSWAALARIESKLYKLPGVYINKSYIRTYPLGKSCAHVLGYLGMPNQAEITLYGLQHAKEARIGKAGAEALLNPVLIGKAGNKKVEVDANRVIVRTLTTDESTSGLDVRLTIDSELQKFLYDRLENRIACASVMEIPTGRLLALCSTPAFDPNLFATNFDNLAWQSLIKNKDSPLINKVIGKAYPPGSTWKVITALAILEAGIDANETVLCKGYIEIGNRKFHCAKTSGHGHVNLHDALTCSCNCYFYKMGIKAGLEAIANTARILGMGERSYLELPQEISGIIPSKELKLSKSGKSAWTQGDTANVAIGQGFVLATPIQLLIMIARLAGGKAVIPSLLKDRKEHKFDSLPFSFQNLELVRTALMNVFNSKEGTGFASRIKEEEFMMAGKTGTAQVISQNTPSDILKKSLRSHSIFVGYAPVYNSTYACVVVAENAGWGSITAGPIGSDTLLFAQKHCQASTQTN